MWKVNTDLAHNSKTVICASFEKVGDKKHGVLLGLKGVWESPNSRNWVYLTLLLALKTPPHWAALSSLEKRVCLPLDMPWSVNIIARAALL